MKPPHVLHALGGILRPFSFAFLVPIPFALAYEPWNGGLGIPDTVLAFAASFALVQLVAVGLRGISREVRGEDIPEHEAYLSVGVGSLLVADLGAVPFILTRTTTDASDALFESMSGITTTGATILSDVEAAAPSIWVWRATLQLVGGIGIIILGASVIGRLSHGGRQLLQAEAPGPSVSRITAKLRHTLRSLGTLCGAFAGVLMAVLLVVFLANGLPAKQAFLDAYIHAATTASTGGFSNHQAGIGHYDSIAVEVVVMLGMLAAATGFALLYSTIHRDPRRLLQDPEWRVFMAGIAVAILLVTGILLRTGDGLIAAFRGAAFTVVSMATTAGHSNVDPDAWPVGASAVLVVTMFIGGTSGSTAGGLKVVRAMILLKVVRRAFRKLVHPRAIVPVRMGREVMKDETVWMVIAFLFTYLSLWLLGSILLVATEPNLSLLAVAGAAAGAISNVGPGIGAMGPDGSYAGLQWGSKTILALLMWVGRVELFAALLLFNPRSWKH